MYIDKGNKGTNVRWNKRGGVIMKENFEIVIPQILVFTIIQHTLYSLHILVISSVYSHPLNTLFEVLSYPKIHDSIGYTTFDLF